LADNYQKRKWSAKLKRAGWSKELAVASMEVMSELEPVALCGLEGEAKWGTVMCFDETEGYGKEVVGAIKELQIKHSQEVSGKSSAVIRWLEERESKQGVLNKLSGNAEMPQLKARIKSLPEAMWHTDLGSTAWIAGARNRTLCWGPVRMPLAGIGGFVQVCQDSPPITFIMINAEELSKNGLLNFDEAIAFLSTESGARLVRETSVWITLESPGQIMYLPYAAIGIPIVGCFKEDDKKGADKSIGTFWHYPIWNTDLAAAVSDQTWKSIETWNFDYMGPRVGDKLWKERHEVLTKLSGARKAKKAAASA